MRLPVWFGPQAAAPAVLPTMPVVTAGMVGRTAGSTRRLPGGHAAFRMGGGRGPLGAWVAGP